MIFIDTGAFVSRYLSRDQYYKPSIEFWKKLGKDKSPCYTSNFVLDETFTLIGRRAGNAFAAERAQAIYTSEALKILRPDNNDELKALKLFTKYSDQSVSFTDCISFVLMKREKIKQAFTFDSHFELAGFIVKP